MKPKPLGPTDLVDIHKPFIIEIEESDRDAIQCDPWECVIANAINRQFGCDNAQVGQTMVYFNKGNIPMRAELSRNAQQMIRAYDKDNQIMPAGIQIEVKPPARKVGTVKPKGPKTSKRDPSVKTRVVKGNRNPSTRNIHVKPPHESQ